MLPQLEYDLPLSPIFFFFATAIDLRISDMYIIFVAKNEKLNLQFIGVKLDIRDMELE